MAKKKNDDSVFAELQDIQAENKENAAPVYTQNIPEDEIWTYRIEGLQPPRIVDKHISTKLKVSIVVILVIAICCSILMSIKAVHNDTYKYSVLEDGTCELIKYSNPGDVTEVAVDFINGDKSLPVTVLHEYAFNCDEKIETVTIGKDVSKIDGKSFYSCWSLQNVFVDDDNPYYCDLDGVLYNKELSEIIYYPNGHDRYLRQKTDYDLDNIAKVVEVMDKCTRESKTYDDLSVEDKRVIDKFTADTGISCDESFVADYNEKVRTYVLPNTVTKIGKLALAYSKIADLYMPNGVKTIETMGAFKCSLFNIYSYPADEKPDGTYIEAAKGLASYVNSLPESLEYIGSDAFSYTSSLSYMYIPASVKEIGHHAFWDCVYNDGDRLIGLSSMNVELDEKSFKENTKAGESWLPKFDSKLFRENVEVLYAAERE